MQSMGERLKETRELAGDLSARELGWLADITETHPAMIESGLRPIVNATIVAKLATVLGTTTDFLIAGVGPAPTERQVVRAVAAARASRGSRRVGGVSG